MHCLWWRHKFGSLWILAKHKNLNIWERTAVFTSAKKIHWLHLKGCIMGKTSFLAELTFNWNAVLFSSFNGLSPLLSHKREILSDHSVNRHNATQLAADKLHLSDQLLKTKGVFITQSNIYNGSIFAKKSSIVMFCCVLSGPLKPFFHVERLAQLQLIPRFTRYFSILVN